MPTRLLLVRRAALRERKPTCLGRLRLRAKGLLRPWLLLWSGLSCWRLRVVNPVDHVIRAFTTGLTRVFFLSFSFTSICKIQVLTGR